MKLYRITKEKWIDRLDGVGAFKAGARWNSRGVYAVYTSSSMSLATLESLVHLQVDTIPNDYFSCEIEIPKSVESSFQELNLKEAEKLTPLWDQFPYSPETQAYGDKFFNEKKYLLLKVPSVVVKTEFNYLINPLHPDFKKIININASPYSFDSRLIESDNFDEE